MIKKRIKFFVPSLYFLVGLFICLNLEFRLSENGLFMIKSARSLIEGYGYQGFAAVYWPPLYGVLSTLLGYVVGFETGAELVSLASASLLLWVLFEFTLTVGGTVLSGLLIQCVVALNPYYLRIALLEEYSMLDALLVVMFIWLALLFFRKTKLSLLPLVILSICIFFTRHPSSSILISFSITLIYLNRGKKFYEYVIYFGFVLALILIGGYLFLDGLHASESWVAMLDGFIDKNLLEYGNRELHELKQFKFSSIFDVALKYPRETIWNWGMNMLQIPVILLSSSKFLGIFSWLVPVGILSLAVWNVPKLKFFLYFGFAIYCSVISLAHIKAEYLLYFSLVFSIFGLIFLVEILKNPPGLFWSEGRNIERVVIVVLLFLSSQFHYRSGWYQNQLNRVIRESPWRRYVKVQFLKNKKSDNTRTSTRVLTHATGGLWRIFDRLNKAGITAVPTLLPRNSIKETLCHEGLSKARQDYIERFNFPPGRSFREELPADYYLVRESFNPINAPGERFYRGVSGDMNKMLKPVQWWEKQYGIMLYRIRKSNLDCETLQASKQNKPN